MLPNLFAFSFYKYIVIIQRIDSILDLVNMKLAAILI